MLFILGWIDGYDNKSMKTDVHYNSMNGDGMFNWRMLFPFQYIPEESVMVIEKKVFHLCTTIFLVSIQERNITEKIVLIPTLLG